MHGVAPARRVTVESTGPVQLGPAPIGLAVKKLPVALTLFAIAALGLTACDDPDADQPVEIPTAVPSVEPSMSMSPSPVPCETSVSVSASPSASASVSVSPSLSLAPDQDTNDVPGDGGVAYRRGSERKPAHPDPEMSTLDC